MSLVYFPADKSGAEWRQMAADDRKRSADSFEHSDTDGFMSQWASDTMASLYDLAAEIADDDGMIDQDVPFVDGEPVTDWGWVNGRFGASVRVGRGDDVKWWHPSEARKGAVRLRNDTAKGVVWGTVRGEAVAKLAGHGTGMAGALSVHPVAELKWGAPVTVVKAVSDRYSNDWGDR